MAGEDILVEGVGIPWRIQQIFGTDMGHVFEEGKEVAFLNVPEKVLIDIVLLKRDVKENVVPACRH